MYVHTEAVEVNVCAECDSEHAKEEGGGEVEEVQWWQRRKRTPVISMVWAEERSALIRLI
jgi:uncharacterized protein YhfF